MKERIRQIMEQCGMSQQDFSVKLGISPASLSSIFTGRTNPTNNHVMAIHKAFPQISVDWLMFGEGEMYTTSQSGESHSEGSPSAVTSAAGDVDFGHDTVYPDGAAMSSLFADEAVSQPRPPRSEGVAGISVVAPRPERKWRDHREPALQDNVKIIDRPVRKIKEIRVFFDDGTYEAFVPSSK